ncbi:hypothetical protein MTO96_031885 [Rhipicephalus appendiculatus]
MTVLTADPMGTLPHALSARQSQPDCHGETVSMIARPPSFSARMLELRTITHDRNKRIARADSYADLLDMGYVTPSAPQPHSLLGAEFIFSQVFGAFSGNRNRTRESAMRLKC